MAGEHDVILEKLDTMKEKLDSIHTQVIHTNGRVSSLERWRDRIAGGITVLTILVIPIAIKVVGDWIH